MGKQALHGIGDKLRSLDVFSAWRLLPDVQVGIVHRPSESSYQHVIDLLGRLAAAKI